MNFDAALLHNVLVSQNFRAQRVGALSVEAQSKGRKVWGSKCWVQSVIVHSMKEYKMGCKLWGTKYGAHSKRAQAMGRKIWGAMCRCKVCGRKL